MGYIYIYVYTYIDISYMIIYIYIKYHIWLYIDVFLKGGSPKTYIFNGWFSTIHHPAIGVPFILGNLQMGKYGNLRKSQSVSKNSLIHLRDFESCVRFLTSFHQAFNFLRLLVECAAQSHDFHPDWRRVCHCLLEFMQFFVVLVGDGLCLPFVVLPGK